MKKPSRQTGKALINEPRHYDFFMPHFSFVHAVLHDVLSQPVFLQAGGHEVTDTLSAALFVPLRPSPA